MFKTLKTLTTAVVMLTLTGCANTHNPLDDYEQVEPAAILDVGARQAVCIRLRGTGKRAWVMR
jgi:hypothetical protein